MNKLSIVSLVSKFLHAINPLPLICYNYWAWGLAAWLLLMTDSADSCRALPVRTHVSLWRCFLNGEMGDRRWGWLNSLKARCTFPQVVQTARTRGGAIGICIKSSGGFIRRLSSHVVVDKQDERRAWFSEGGMIRLETLIEVTLFSSSCSSLSSYETRETVPCRAIQGKSSDSRQQHLSQQYPPPPLLSLL